MPENIVEILIRARDEATRVFNQAIANHERASQAVVASSQRVARASEVSSRELRAFGTSTRFAAVGLANELSPALGTGVSRLTSLASVAALSGTALGALATFGIGAAVVALGTFISRTRDAEKVQRELNQAVALGQVPRLQKEISELREREQKLLKEGVNVAVTGFEQEGNLREAALADIRNEIELRQRQINQINAANIAGARRIELFKDEEDARKKSAELEDARIRGLAASIDKEIRLRVEAEHEVNAEALTAYDAFLAEKESKVRESARQQLEINAKLLGDLQRAAVEAEGAISAEQGAVVAAAAQDFEERFTRQLEDLQDPVKRTMTSLGNSAADALFDAMLDRSRNLADLVRSFFEGFARDIFRNTLAQLFGGKAQGLSLQTLLSLGGGGGPLGRIATAGASVTAAGMVSPAAAAAEIPSPMGGPLIEGLPETDLTAGQAIGGGLLVAGGALGIVGGLQAEDPFSGALSGGLGGFGVGAGLATLAPSLGAVSVLGPIGAAIGLGLGIFGGMRGRKKRKAAEDLSRQAAEVDAFIARLEQNAAGLNEAQLEELSAYLVSGMIPSDPHILSMLPNPRIVRLAGQWIREKRGAAALQEIVAAVRGPLAEAERRRLEQQIATATLPELEQILAAPVSPDFPGGLELRLEAERRRLEILGRAEEIGGIAITEQLEGGVRRRTIVGAGAFGGARASAAGLDVVITPSNFRRYQREFLLDNQAALEELLRALRSVGQAIDIRIEDIGVLA